MVLDVDTTASLRDTLPDAFELPVSAGQLNLAMQDDGMLGLSVNNGEAAAQVFLDGDEASALCVWLTALLVAGQLNELPPEGLGFQPYDGQLLSVDVDDAGYLHVQVADGVGAEAGLALALDEVRWLHLCLAAVLLATR